MAEFKLLTEAGLAATGGLLYGTTYVGSKKLLGEQLNEKQTKNEILANSAAATASGLGGVLLLKALRQ